MRTFRLAVRFTTATLFLSASLAGCGDRTGPPSPALVRVSGGNGQIARIGTVLPTPIVATVLDGDGQPAVGVQVNWRAEGDGQLTALSEKTDERGQTSARWQLGNSQGQRMAQAALPGIEPAVFTAIAEGPDALLFDDLQPIAVPTYDGSGQVVHPDYAATPAGVFGLPFHLAITPYPFGDPHYENPSFFDGARKDRWALPEGAPDPVVLPNVGYLSDPDLVYVPEQSELWLYYRQVTDHNIVNLVRTRDGRTWSAPVEVVRAPNHQIVSPSVVRRAEGDWWMFAVNAGQSGCTAAATTIEVRRSEDGLRWSPPTVVDLGQPGYWAWHIDVQWIPSLNTFWAVYNAKAGAGCTTPVVFLSESGDGTTWQGIPKPVLIKGRIQALQDIVYRTTLEYDPETDAITFWFSGARYDGKRYVWGAAVERRHRAEVFAMESLDAIFLPPAPAPLDDWP